MLAICWLCIEQSKTFVSCISEPATPICAEAKLLNSFYRKLICLMIVLVFIFTSFAEYVEIISDTHRHLLVEGCSRIHLTRPFRPVLFFISVGRSSKMYVLSWRICPPRRGRDILPRAGPHLCLLGPLTIYLKKVKCIVLGTLLSWCFMDKPARFNHNQTS